MAFYTRRELMSRPLLEARAHAQHYHRKTAATKHHIFLSHSHQDADLLNCVADLLGEFANAIYIDWKDAAMPTITSPETAAILKQKIRNTSKFILLATGNALASRWVPWELGVADLSNGMSNVAIFPVTDPPRDWTGNEYVGIYSTIEKADSGNPAVFEPGHSTGPSLSTWLTRS